MPAASPGQALPRSSAPEPPVSATPSVTSDTRAVCHAEIAAVAVVAVFIFALYVWSGWYWIDLIDEGYFVYLGSRVHAGDLPYRDFDTYYTPGIFYLFAWTFELFGVSIEPIRVLMSCIRVLWALLLYGLARRVAPWPFALLPFLVIGAIESSPVFPEPHPSWPAMAATFGVIESIVRHQASGRRRWLFVAGGLAAVAFAFKQNVGAFAALAIAGYLLLICDRRPIGRLLLVARPGFALALGGAVTTLLWPGLDPPLAVTVWLPLVLTLGLLVWSGRQGVAGWTTGLPCLVLDTVAAGAAFVAVTLGWLVPLTLALGVGGIPWPLFVGHVNQGALILPLELPSPGTRPVLLVAIWLPIVLALASNRRALPSRWVMLGATAASVVAYFVPVAYTPDEDLVEDPGFYPWLEYLFEELGNLFTYLPALGAWAGLTLLVAAVIRRAPIDPLAWYLLASCLTALALYPRIDTIHAMFAGPPLLVIGAMALAAVHRELAGRSGLLCRVLVYLSLLIVPIAAVAPHVYWRYVTIVHADPRAPVPPAYVDLALDRARVQVPEHIASSVRGVVLYVQSGLPPDAPLFVYPVNPLFNFLADRPNPTRFNHFIAGALTPSDLDEVIRDLNRAKPRFIVWDHGGATYFKTDLTNRRLSDYIWNCYSQVANFTPYLILERHCQ
jgi:hypothetical protein